MLDLSLFKNGTFAGANLVAILVTLAMFGIFVFFPIYMQTFRGWSPTQAGAALLPWTLMVVIFAPIAGKLSDRVGSRWLMAGGMTTVAVCCLLLSTVTIHSTFWHMLPAFILGGIGMSFTMTPMSAAAMGAVPVAKAGVASGVLNTFRQVGVALGIAIMGAIVADRAASHGGPAPEAFVYGLTFGMKVSSIICRAPPLPRPSSSASTATTRSPSSTSRSRSLHDQAQRPGAQARSRRDRVPHLREGQLPRVDHCRDRPRDRRHRARALSPLLLEAELYLACLDSVWQQVHVLWEKAIADEPAPENWIKAIGKAYLEARAAARIVLVDLWIQALTEAADDPEIRRALRGQVREVHEYVAAVIRRAQEAGGIVAERDADAEAWIFISLGLSEHDRPPPRQHRWRRVRRHRLEPARVDDRPRPLT